MKKVFVGLAILLSLFLSTVAILFTLGRGEKHPAAPLSIKPEKASLDNISSYANTYKEYSEEDFEKLKRFDIVAIEPYNIHDIGFLSRLKSSGVIVLAYISIGEADNDRRYWETWEADEDNPDNASIPRTVTSPGDSIFIGEDPSWKGSYFVDASSDRWQKIVLDEEIPYILWRGGGLYDGLMMDLVDVVDIYEGRPGEGRMRQGMVDLIKKIRDKYPHLLLVPNRGFGILEEMAPYIDAFKFEEMTAAFGNVKGEDHFGEYYLKIGKDGKRENQEEIDQLLDVLKRRPMPVLVLDHIQTNPPDPVMAKNAFDEAKRLSRETGYKFIWYGNSLDQDLPIWDFLPLKR